MDEYWMAQREFFRNYLKYEKSGVSTRYQVNIYDGIWNELLLGGTRFLSYF